jgi:hypothetical protein
MFEPLILLGLFGAVVWVIARSIFILIHGESRADVYRRPRDTIANFVEENYGSHFVHESSLGAAGLHKL